MGTLSNIVANVVVEFLKQANFEAKDIHIDQELLSFLWQIIII